jgi:hypothetical protein
MKKFLQHFFSILLFVFLLILLCDVLYSIIYRDANPRSKLKYILNLKDENFDIVFLGSSRVANHIDTDLFNKLSHNKTINLGVQGAGLNDNMLQLKLLLESNDVKYVFLQIDSNLNSTVPSNISTSEAMPFIGNPIIRSHIKKYYTNFDYLYYIPFYRYAINDSKIGFREVFFSFLNKKPAIDPSNGYTPKFGNTIPDTKPILMEENTVLHMNPILNEIRELCKQKNTKLVLFITPFCSKINPDSYVKKMKKIAPDLIDLTQGYPDSLFYNCGHLNDKGAKKLTQALYESTKKLLD